MPPIAADDERGGGREQNHHENLRAEVAHAHEYRLAGLGAVRLKPCRDRDVGARHRVLLGKFVGNRKEQPCARDRHQETNRPVQSEVCRRMALGKL